MSAAGAEHGSRRSACAGHELFVDPTIRFPRIEVARGLFAAVLAAAVTAQDVVQNALVDLDDPRLQASACAALIARGDAAVPALRTLIASHGEVATDKLLGALFVVGCLGPKAVAAMPELLDAYEYADDGRVRRQVLWAIGQVAPFAEGRAELDSHLSRHAAPGDDMMLLQAVHWRLALGATPSPQQLLRMWRIGGAGAVAAVEALTVHERRAEPEFEDVCTAIESALQAILALDGYPWDAQCESFSYVGAMSNALHAAGRDDATIVRGLLWHWDPARRCFALEAMGKKVLDGQVRAEIAWALADGSPELRHLALATVRGWGARMAAAVPSLHAQSGAADKAFAKACESALARWLEKGEGADEVAGRIVRGACLAALGQEAPPLPEFEMRDVHLLVDLLRGCRGRTGWLQPIARFVRDRGLAFPEVVRAFVACLGTTDRTSWHEALDALTLLGPVVAKVEPEIDALILRSMVMYPAIDRLALIGDAWIRAGRSATDADLAAALHGDRWHVALRAASEVVQRGGKPGDAVVIAAAACAERTFAPVAVHQGEEWARQRGRGYMVVAPVVEAQWVRTACTLVLLAAGDERWRRDAALRAASVALDEPLEAVADTLAAAKAEGRLPELAQRLDAVNVSNALRMCTEPR